MSKFNIGDRVHIDGPDFIGCRDNIGENGVIAYTYRNGNEAEVVIDGYSYVFQYSSISLLQESPLTVMNWANLTDKNGCLFYVPKAEA